VVEQESSDVLQLVRQLSILNIRYNLIVSGTDVKWPRPFSADFSFLESIQKGNPPNLAKSNTKSTEKLFSKLQLIHPFENSEPLRDIKRHWSDLSVDVQACLDINGDWTVSLMDLAYVRWNSSAI